MTKTRNAGEATYSPYFFFSYARADCTEYLERLFYDLRRQVAQYLAIHDGDDVAFPGGEAVAFRDVNSIKTGEDWNAKIAKAAQVSRVLVCVYSFSFFTKEEGRDFCAKEFSAFLQRHGTLLRYERYIENGQALFRVGGARNIVPILWYSERDLLSLKDLPPPMIRSIQYTLNHEDSNVSREYSTKGMRKIAIRRGRTYSDIIDSLAKSICEFSNNPLPALPAPPDFSLLANAFWEAPDQTTPNLTEPYIGSAMGDAMAIAALTPPSPDTRPRDFRGPGQLLAIEMRSHSRRESAWMPYNLSQSLSDLIEDIAIERRLTCRSEVFHSRDPDCLSRLQAMLSAATERNNVAVIILDPYCLAEEETRNQLRLLTQGTWRGGFLIPGDGSRGQQLDLTQRVRDVINISPDRQEQIVVEIPDSVDDFRVSVLSILVQILAIIVKYGAVLRPTPNNAGPEMRPRITNVNTPEASYDKC